MREGEREREREGERRERNYLKVHIKTCTVLVIMYVNHDDQWLTL